MRSRVVGSRSRICTWHLPCIRRAQVTESAQPVNWSGWQELHLRPPSSKLGRLTSDLHPEGGRYFGDARRIRTALTEVAAPRLKLLGHRITKCASGWLVGVEPTIDRSQRSALAAWLQPHRSTLRTWYPWQESHLHTLRRCVLSAVCLLFHHRGTDLVKLRGLEPRKFCLKGRAREPLCIQLRMAIVSGLEPDRPRMKAVLLGPLCIHDRELVERIGIAPIRLSACKANPGS
jgi:hypothetical protein